MDTGEAGASSPASCHLRIANYGLIGRVRTVPRWDGAAFEPRRVVSLTLSVDHRALDGAAAARFMATLEELLRDPVAGGLA